MTKDKISLAHGAGGSAMMKLIADIALKEFSLKRQGEVGLDELDDGASLSVGDKTLVFTTDSHTINPPFFPGGDIGKLAVAGTVNDLAVMGGRPLAMACAVVLQEGFPIESLRKICQSMELVAREVNVPMVTGDTKVMERGALDGVIVTTTGVGVADKLITDRGLRPGNKIIVSGSVGDHGITILAHREGIEIGGDLRSDVAPIWSVVQPALEVGGVTAMKDPTRGGLATALNELAAKVKVGIVVNESDIPISTNVKAVSEMLGIDPLNITNEGKVIICVEPERCDEVLAAVRGTKYGRGACVIGEAIDKRPGEVTIKTAVGGQRLLRASIGDPAPRIC
jgi:hydrogenase expression/formation protein HypE